MQNQSKTVKQLNKEISAYLHRYFVTNTYAMAVQMKDGKYVAKYLPVSEFLIEEMLNQRGSIGCYQQCYKSDMVTSKFFLRMIMYQLTIQPQKDPLAVYTSFGLITTAPIIYVGVVLCCLSIFVLNSSSSLFGKHCLSRVHCLALCCPL